MRFRKAQPEDCHAVNEMMELLIDEIYSEESEKVRRILKANYTQDALIELCQDPQSVLYVIDVDGRLAAFLYGWMFQNVFTIYWIFVHKQYRGRGIIKKLMKDVEKEVTRLKCFKIEMYAYAPHNKFLDFCSKLGFQKGVLIKKSMFGFQIQHIYKYIGMCSAEDKIKRIKIIGEAGQGVKLLSYILASILSQLGNEVSLNLEYDSAVRSGTISSDLIYSENEIENPIIDEADILIKFTKTRDWFPARHLIIDESFCGEQSLTCSIHTSKGTDYGLENVAISKFGSKIYINMIALGKILRHIGINIMLINITDLLPKKSIEKNIEAIKYGFNYKDDT